MRIEPIYRIQLKDMFENKLPFDIISLADLITEYGINFTIGQDSKVADLFQKVFNRFYEYIIFESHDMDSIVISQKFAMWLRRFLNKYDCTKTYYETLIKAYETNESKLMADIEAETTNEVIFNDTPQTEGGVFKPTEYATTYTKTTSKTKSPMKSPIERLKDLQDNLLNLWKDWSNQFHCLFLEKQEGRFYE